MPATPHIGQRRAGGGHGTQIIADWESDRIGVFLDPDTGKITTINGTTVMTHPGLRPIP